MSPRRPHIPDGSGGVHLNVEGDGFSGAALGWGIALSLVVGLLGGVWAARAIWGYEPSPEYVEQTVALEAQLEASEDSLRDARRAVVVADRAVAEAESATLDAVDDLEEARVEAALARQRADAAAARAVGARASGASAEEVAEAEAEAADTAAEAEDAERAECAACGRTVSRQAATISELHGAVASRARRILFLEDRMEGLQDALTLAQAEVDRATGRLVPKWHDGFGLTLGYGCAKGRGCGLSAGVGYSFSPRRVMAWLK